MKIQDILRSYDIATIMPGLRGSRRSKYGVCPLPQHIHSRHPTPSFSVFWKPVRGEMRQYWKCHGVCGGLSGNVIDLIGFMNIPGYRKGDREMYFRAADILTGGEFTIHPPQAPPPAPPLSNGLWRDCLPPSRAVVDYALSRGLTQAEIDLFKIGSLPSYTSKPPFEIHEPGKWMAIPILHHGYLRAIKLRNITEYGMRYLALPGSQKGLFNFDAVYMTNQPVLLVKGEICAMVAHRFGFLACSPTCGEGGNIKNMLSALALARTIVVGDNDPNPETRSRMRSFTERRAALLHGLLRFPPEGWKDWDAWALEDTVEAIRVTRGWIEELESEE